MMDGVLFGGEGPALSADIAPLIREKKNSPPLTKHETPRCSAMSLLLGISE